MNVVELRERGLVELLDVELTRALARAARAQLDPDVELAVALASRNVRNGHACLPIEIEASALWPGECFATNPLPAPEAWAASLRASPLTRDGPLVLDRTRLYLRRYWELERGIARQLALRAAPMVDEIQMTPARRERLDRLFSGGASSLQAEAAQRALRQRVSLLCGGPGTGKTTTVARIVALLIEEARSRGEASPRVLLLAPTGKAAARLGEAVQRAKSRIDAESDVLDAIPTEASTVQRALGMRTEGLRFSRNAERPLEADVVIVDEGSMIDLTLMFHLLEATPVDARLLIVGDPDQLTSVEAGSVLQDLVTASRETWWQDRLTVLTKTHRYDPAQPLGRLVGCIQRNDVEGVESALGESADNQLVWRPPEQLASELDRAAIRWSEIVQTRDPVAHFEARNGYVVLSPFRKGPTGTRRLGTLLEERLSATGRLLTRPILIEENSSELRVYNGDFAFTEDTDPPMAVLSEESGVHRRVAQARLPRFSDAFALSVHKAQGSEFEEVLIVLPEDDAPLLTRELLYTAVSRAKERVRIVGSKEVFVAAMQRRARRDSGLVDAIGTQAPT